MRLAGLVLVLVLVAVAGCSLVYNPGKLQVADDASSVQDASGDVSTPDDDAAIDGAIDAPADAAIDATMIDAGPCGATSQVCCASDACNVWNECLNGTCSACGGTLQSCCDTGVVCMGTLSCVAGLCTL